MDADEFQKQMKKELEKWKELNASPEALSFDGGTFGLSMRIELLFDMLEEAGIATREAMDEKYRDLCLERHRELREEVVEPQIKKMRQDAIRAGTMPRMDIPRGNHKGH